MAAASIVENDAEETPVDSVDDALANPLTDKEYCECLRKMRVNISSPKTRLSTSCVFGPSLRYREKILFEAAKRCQLGPLLHCIGYGSPPVAIRKAREFARIAGDLDVVKLLDGELPVYEKMFELAATNPDDVDYFSSVHSTYLRNVFQFYRDTMFLPKGDAS